MYVYRKIFKTAIYIQYTCKIKHMYVYRKIFETVFKIYYLFTSVHHMCAWCPRRW